jgi:hypothetical protein
LLEIVERSLLDFSQAFDLADGSLLEVRAWYKPSPLLIGIMDPAVR